jgi:PST family polysaccharide transporter
LNDEASALIRSNKINAGAVLDQIEDASLKARSVRGGIATLFSQLLKMGIRLASQILIARLLLPSDYGLVAMVAPVLGLLLLLADMGLGQAVVQHPDITHKQLSSLFWFGLAINTLVALLVVVVSPLISFVYSEPRLTLLAIALAALMPISGLTVQHLALLNRNMLFGTLAVLDILSPAIGLGLGLWAAMSGYSYWSLVIATAGEGVSFAILVWLASRWRPGLHWRGSGIRGIMQTGGHLTLSSFANYLTTTVDTVLLGVAQGSTVLGIYDRGYRLVTLPLGQMMLPFGRIAIPLLMRLGPANERYGNAYALIVQLMLLFTVPGTLVVMVFAKPLLLILLGPQWNGVAPVVAWLCFGGLASPVFTSVMWLFATQGRTGQQLRYVVATSVISVISFVVGLPWGAAGVAAGAGLSFVLISTPLVCWGAMRSGPIRLSQFIRGLLPLGLAGVATALLLIALQRILALQILSLLAVALLLAYITFASTLALLPSGRRMIRDSWQLRKLVRSSTS